jgi:GNAT superfamily N-acetyltransferase
MSIILRPATPADAPAVSALVRASFQAFVAPDWGDDARTHFMAETTPAKMAGFIDGAAFASVALLADQVLGVLLMPRPDVVRLCFVAPTHVGQGIGRALWEAARQHIESAHSGVQTVELNASPYAVGAYQAWGFYPLSKPYRKAGWVATHMACWLPDRHLAPAEAPSKCTINRAVSLP